MQKKTLILPHELYRTYGQLHYCNTSLLIRSISAFSIVRMIFNIIRTIEKADIERIKFPELLFALILLEIQYDT